MNIRVIIRKFQPSDREYEALAQIYCAAVGAGEFGYHEYASGAEFRAADEFLRAAGIPFRRYVAEATSTGRILGYAQFHHTPEASDPLRFVGVIRVHPNHPSRELESCLYAQMMDDLNWLDTVMAQAGIFSHQRKGIAFLEKRGAYERYHCRVSLLELQRFHFRSLAFEKQKRDPIRLRQRAWPVQFESWVSQYAESYIQ